MRGEDALLAASSAAGHRCGPPGRSPTGPRQGIDPSTVSLAVVVQEMVDADAAGVLFTANPTSGRRQEAVIAAAWGLGESVVGWTVNTDDLVVDKADGRITERRIARQGGDDRVRGRGHARNRRAGRPAPGAGARRRGGGRADPARGRGSRPTSVPRRTSSGRGPMATSSSCSPVRSPHCRCPRPTPPTDWSVPDPTAMYVRASIVEQLPDPLTPLFADLIDSSVTRSLQALFTELTGEGVIRDSDVTCRP